MTMLERYGRNYPCILDNELFKELPDECKDYLADYDFFLYYDDDDVITLATWDTEEQFETIGELTEYVKEEIRLAKENGCW